MKHNPSFVALHPRLLAGVGVLLAAFLGWATLDHTARSQEPDKKPPDKPRREEEEDTPPKMPPKRKIRVEEEDPNAKPVRTGVNPSGDFAQLAREAKHPAVQQMYRKLAVPFDLVNQGTADQARPSMRVEPLEKLYRKDRARLFGTVKVTPLDAENKPLAAMDLVSGNIRSIEPYEDIALDDLDRFRKAGWERNFANKIELYEQMLIEEQLLSAILRFHESAKERGVRKGSDWEGVESQLRSRLLDVMLKQLAELTAANDWEAAYSLASRVADTFPGEAELQVIAPRVFELLQASLKDRNTNINRMRDAQQRLRAMIDRFPGNPQIQTLKQSLKKQAEALFKQAQDLGKSSNKDDLARAQNLLRQAEEIWPTLPELQTVRESIRQKYPILRVGIRGELPRNMSPHTALTDNELRAVEMIFESLVRFTPDGNGMGRYQTGLAEGRPQVIELGRQFQLPPNALWSDNEPLTLADIRATFRAVKEGLGPDHSLAWQNLLHAEKEIASGGDGFRVNVNLSKGHIEPLGLMNHKIVPAHALQKGKEDAFGKDPIGSGPFAFAGRDSEQGRPYLKFTANLNYGTRSSKLGLPRFREVRLFQYTDGAKEAQTKSLSILLDLTPEEAAKLQDDRTQNRWKVTIPTAKEPNRRVYYLAVNHRKPPLDDENVRAALALAINREALLDHHYRGPLQRQVHKSLNSPYPAHCWACNPKLHSRTDKTSLDPYDAALARAKFAAAAKKVGGDELVLTLKYPGGDPVLASAMKELAAQVGELLKVRIDPVAEDAKTLRQCVENTFNYDLAYCHYDFADDTFWLGPLFAPKRGREENVFAYKNEQLPDLLQKSIDYREFARVRDYTRAVHDLLARELPVIPLWQLDPLHAVHDEVKATPFDRHRVFTEIDKWYLE